MLPLHNSQKGAPLGIIVEVVSLKEWEYRLINNMPNKLILCFYVCFCFFVRVLHLLWATHQHGYLLSPKFVELSQLPYHKDSHSLHFLGHYHHTECPMFVSIML